MSSLLERWKCRVCLLKDQLGLRRELMRIITFYYRISQNLKGFISHFHHNFPIYSNYYYINVILNFLLFQNFDLIVTFSDLKVHQIILLLLFYFSSFLNMYCYYLSFVIIILYRIYVYVKIIVYNNHILISYSNENFQQIIYLFTLCQNRALACQLLANGYCRVLLFLVNSRCADGCMHYFGRGEMSIAK